MYKYLVIGLFWLLAPLSWGTEVASITACKAEAEIWVCATWKDNRMAVYRSANYISGIEFAGELESGPIKAPLTDAQSGIKAEQISAAGGHYTLQLLACNSAPCDLQMKQLQKIPGSQLVDIKNDNQLWQVLLVGQYVSIKSAQQAAAGLMSQYQLRDKPWVRTLESIARRRVGS